MSARTDSEFYAEVRRRQHAIESTIAGYRDKITDCERELEECFETLHQIVYPILTLPNEITSEIFVCCLPSSDSLLLTTNPHHAPMQLLRVCSEWRSIAMATPRLWIDLRLNFYRLPLPFFEPENLDKFLTDYLARVRACPLSLFLEGGAKRDPEREGIVQRSVPAILQRLSSNIEVLELAANINYLPQHTPGFPLLRNLTITLAKDDIEEEDTIRFRENPIQTFSAAPQLRELSLYYAPPSLFVLRWETLALFTGRGLSSKECVEVLRLAPSLVTCIVQDTPFVADTPSISHPNLQSFQWTIWNGWPFFQFLTFPAIENLFIWPDDPLNDADQLHFLRRSSSSLLTLSSREIPFEALSAMAVLTFLELDMSDYEYVSQFYALLNRTKNPRFLPQLQRLECEQREPFVNMILVDALSSRGTVAQDVGGRAKLQSFHQFWSADDLDPELQVEYEDGIAIALDNLQENGMVIYIGHMPE